MGDLENPNQKTRPLPLRPGGGKYNDVIFLYFFNVVQCLIIFSLFYLLTYLCMKNEWIGMYSKWDFSMD